MGGEESCIPGAGVPLLSTCALDDRGRHRRARYHRARHCRDRDRRARYRRARDRCARDRRACYRRAHHRRARNRRARYRRARYRRARHLCSRSPCSLHPRVSRTVSRPVRGAGAMDGAMALSGWEEDKGANDDVTTSVVVAAHAATSLEARRRALAAAQIHRPRYRGSVPGRIPHRPRNFALGLHCILREYFGVDGLATVFGREQFDRRFRVPMSVFLCIYRAIKDRPFWMQRVDATGQP